ncbi:hypothetical protein [Metaclostridioides mangenotii]|uniref:hypothetical protein n=1 Tax=Metaclostridioides mangenotii TaxID=1540 RepID=UPI00163A8B5A|nr:hypothetical protein [Clostridioides mangenotii]
MIKAKGEWDIMVDSKTDEQKDNENVIKIEKEEDVVVLEIDSNEFEKIMSTLDLFK